MSRAEKIACAVAISLRDNPTPSTVRTERSANGRRQARRRKGDGTCLTE
jgi:hypothetical protein